MKSLKKVSFNIYFALKWRRKLNSEFAARYLVAARLVLPVN